MVIAADQDTGRARIPDAGADGLHITRRPSGQDGPRVVIVIVTTFDLDEDVHTALHGRQPASS
ncbi:hypothetical protein [Streptomyces sp. NPDC048269]|uniref:hypothetical protein n=1 Tax=Streptomyces sp. NPDC048269 TaxID=3155753 RepID=UPI00343CB03C